MSMEGTQLARALLSIHELEMQQAARNPGCLLSDRIERRAVFRSQEHRTVCGVGRLLVRAGLRLQEYGSAVPQQPPRPSAATQR